MTQIVIVRTRAQATIEEEWVVRLTNHQAWRLKREPSLFDHLVSLETTGIISVTNKEVYDEENREVVDVT